VMEPYQFIKSTNKGKRGCHWFEESTYSKRGKGEGH
jgi:hypothetical protein